MYWVAIHPRPLDRLADDSGLPWVVLIEIYQQVIVIHGRFRELL